MSAYPFQFLHQAGIDKTFLAQRPFAAPVRSHADNAVRFVPSAELENAIHAATALGVPLLLSGDAGAGKTQTAYYVAHRLGLDTVLHFQVKSNSVAQNILYHFDQARYNQDLKHKPDKTVTNKAAYITPGVLWQALGGKEPRVLLIDEIDKAPRDFANDLLYELEKLEFRIPELGKTCSTSLTRRPLVFITYNGETLLSAPFLRRCMHHHLHLDRTLAEKVVAQHRADFPSLAQTTLDSALKHFFKLRQMDLLKSPGLAELLLWLRLLEIAAGSYALPLEDELVRLPFLGMLIKHPADWEVLGSS